MVGESWIGQVLTERGRVLAQSHPTTEGVARERALEMAMVRGWRIVGLRAPEGLRVAS
jgi:hypothetical protein